MIIDAQHLFSNAQAITGTVVSTNVIDLLKDRDIGIGEKMAVVVAFPVALNGGTIDIIVQTDDNEAFSSAVTLIAHPQIAAAAAIAGSRFNIPIPADRRCERYLRVQYTLGANTATVTTFLTGADMVQNENVFPDAITIS